MIRWGGVARGLLHKGGANVNLCLGAKDKRRACLNCGLGPARAGRYRERAGEGEGKRTPKKKSGAGRLSRATDLLWVRKEMRLKAESTTSLIT